MLLECEFEAVKMMISRLPIRSNSGTDIKIWYPSSDSTHRVGGRFIQFFY